MNDRGLAVARNGDVTRLVLSRPERANALDAGLVEALLEAIDTAYGDGTRLLVLAGAGRSFCGGFDLADLDRETDASLITRFHRIELLLQTLHHAPIATAVFAHGRVFGAGADLVCVCEHRVAEPGTAFRMPGLGFGVVLGTRRFALRVGPDAAREILAETRTFEADEAMRLGFVTTVAGRDAWPDIEAGIFRSATALEPEARAALNAATLPDTRIADMASLDESIRRPGLVERIRAYQAKVRAAAGKKD
jgi:enoyl-CoA hydratase